jgi:hypothetical protein
MYRSGSIPANAYRPFSSLSVVSMALSSAGMLAAAVSVGIEGRVHGSLLRSRVLGFHF